MRFIPITELTEPEGAHAIAGLIERTDRLSAQWADACNRHYDLTVWLAPAKIDDGYAPLPSA